MGSLQADHGEHAGERPVAVSRALAKFVVESRWEHIPETARCEATVDVACRIGNAVCPAHYNVGWHSTLTAAFLAQKNFTASECILEAPRGFAHVLSQLHGSRVYRRMRRRASI